MSDGINVRARIHNTVCITERYAFVSRTLSRYRDEIHFGQWDNTIFRSRIKFASLHLHDASEFFRNLRIFNELYVYHVERQ